MTRDVGIVEAVPNVGQAAHAVSGSIADTQLGCKVEAIAADCDLVIVVGAENSSNSQRLVEVALNAGAARGRLVADMYAIDWDEMDGATHIGLSAGASAPESLVHEIIDAMRSRYELVLDENALVEETVAFKLPPVLTRQA